MITNTQIDTLNIAWDNPQDPWSAHNHHRAGRTAETSTGCLIDYRPLEGLVLVTTPDGIPRPCRELEEVVDWLVTAMVMRDLVGGTVGGNQEQLERADQTHEIPSR